MRWLALGIVTLVLTVGAEKLHIPSAALFVALLVGTVFALTGRGPRAKTENSSPLPTGLGMAAQAILGVEIGTLVQRETLSSLGSSWLPVVLACLGTLAISIAAGVLLGLHRDVDAITGALALVAGGASGLVAVAHELGGDERVVAVVQYLRVILVTTSMPIVASTIFSASNQPVVVTVSVGAPWYVDLLFVAGCAGVGTWLAKLTHFPAPALLGPLIVSSAADLAGFHASVPFLLLQLAYVLIGWQAGLRFTMDSVRSIGRVLPWALLLILALTGISAVLGSWLAHATGISVYEGYLATTPGGVYAVLAIAAATGANVTFVVAAQVIRVFMMLFAVPVGAKIYRRYRATT